MSVLEFVTGDPFIVRVRKYHTSRPDFKWFNTYEFRATAGGSDADITELADQVSDFEQIVHHPVAVIDQVTVSTWEADSHPYNPLAFVTLPYSKTGTAGTGGSDVLDLRVALYVRRQVSAGRTGKLFYRACLTEAQVSAAAGRFTLTDASVLQGLIDTGTSTTAMGAYLSSGSTGFLLYLIGAAEDSRPVTALAAAGATVVSNNHRWFNRP